MECPLCGEIHKLRIHAYLIRKIRTNQLCPNTGEYKNIEITIISIFCNKAKKQGKQYTKRLYPPFVIPECNISLENVMMCFLEYPDGFFNFDKLSEILGTFDDRTIKKHIERAIDIFKIATLVISEVLSELPNLSSIPQMKADKTEYRNFETANAALNEPLLKLYGSKYIEIRKDITVFIIYFKKKSRNPIKSTLNHVFKTLIFFDTS